MQWSVWNVSQGQHLVAFQRGQSLSLAHAQSIEGTKIMYLASMGRSSAVGTRTAPFRYSPTFILLLACGGQFPDGRGEKSFSVRDTKSELMLGADALSEDVGIACILSGSDNSRSAEMTIVNHGDLD